MKVNGRLRRKNYDIEVILENGYLIVMGIFIAYKFLETTQFVISWPANFQNKILCVLVAFILARICYSEKYEITETIICMVLSGVLLYAWKMNGYTDLYYLLLMILGAKGIPAKKIIKVYFVITTILLCITVIASLTGYIDNLVYFQEERRRRMAMGSVYPTDFAAHVFYGSLAYVFIRDEKIKWYDTVGILTIAGITFWVTDARMNFLCSLLLVLGICVYMVYRRKWKTNHEVDLPDWVVIILTVMPVLCAGGMLVLTLLFSQSSLLLRGCNKILNNRLYYGKLGIDWYGFTPWGQYIEMMGNGGSIEKKLYYFFIDSSYINGLLCWGVIAFVLILFVFFVICNKAAKNKKWIWLWVFVMVSIQCVIEHHMIEVAYNPFLWLFMAEWTGMEKREINRWRNEENGEKTKG